MHEVILESVFKVLFFKMNQQQQKRKKVIHLHFMHPKNKNKIKFSGPPMLRDGEIIF